MHDDIDGAHIDPQLQRRRRHNARQLAHLEVVFDLGTLFLADRAVVRPGDDGAAAAIAAAGRAGLRHHLCWRWELASDVAEALGVQLIEVG
ncbi:MAG TPA: hypothetical protein VFP01_02190, partial [Propionibacteriaceae bacterium]|nr:hypothetical protein [Propionibacteriaceae bacterium]